MNFKWFGWLDIADTPGWFWTGDDERRGEEAWWRYTDKHGYPRRRGDPVIEPICDVPELGVHAWAWLNQVLDACIAAGTVTPEVKDALHAARLRKPRPPWKRLDPHSGYREYRPDDRVWLTHCRGGARLNEDFSEPEQATLIVFSKPGWWVHKIPSDGIPRYVRSECMETGDDQRIVPDDGPLRKGALATVCPEKLGMLNPPDGLDYGTQVQVVENLFGSCIVRLPGPHDGRRWHVWMRCLQPTDLGIAPDSGHSNYTSDD